MSEEPQIYKTEELASGTYGIVVTSKNGPKNDPTHVVKFFKSNEQRQKEISKSEEIATLTNNDSYKMESINLTPTNYPNEKNFKDLVKGTTYYGAKMTYLGINIEEFLKDRGNYNIELTTLYPQFSDILYLTLTFNKQGTCHRDIRLPNMLINKLGKLTLIDFGFYGTCMDAYIKNYPNRDYAYFIPPESALFYVNHSTLNLIQKKSLEKFTSEYEHLHYMEYITYYTYKEINSIELKDLLIKKNYLNLEYISSIHNGISNSISTWDNFGVGMIFLEILCTKYSKLCTRLKSYINNKSKESIESIKSLPVEDQQFVKTFHLLEEMTDPQLENRITPQEAFDKMKAIAELSVLEGGRRKRRTFRKKHNKRRTRCLKCKH